MTKALSIHIITWPFIMIAASLFLFSCQSNSVQKEMELLQKENELLKKENELIQKEKANRDAIVQSDNNTQGADEKKKEKNIDQLKFKTYSREKKDDFGYSNEIITFEDYGNGTVSWYWTVFGTKYEGSSNMTWKMADDDYNEVIVDYVYVDDEGLKTPQTFKLVVDHNNPSELRNKYTDGKTFFLN